MIQDNRLRLPTDTEIKACCYYEDSKLFEMNFFSYQIDRQQLRKVFESINNQVRSIVVCNESYDYLGGNPKDYDVAELIVGFRFPQLEQLRLRRCKIQKESMKSLISKQWEKLKKLAVQFIELGQDGFQKILQLLAKKLQTLDVSSVGLKPRDFLSFSHYELKKLKQLLLSGNQLGKTGVNYLKKSEFSQLQKMDLSHCRLTDESAKDLCKAQWNRCRLISIKSNPLTCKCIQCFTANNWILESLHTSLNKKLCIQYFSNVTRMESRSQLKFVICVQEGEEELIKSKDNLLKANVNLLDFVI